MSLRVKRSVYCRSIEVYVLDGDMLLYDKILLDATIIVRRHDVVRGGSTILVLDQQASSFHEALF